MKTHWKKLWLVSALMSAVLSGCAHTASLSDGADDVPMPGICNSWDASQGPGALVSAFAQEASLGGGVMLVVAGDAMMIAGQRDLPGSAVEFFLTEDNCLELVRFRRVVAEVRDPSSEVSLAEARAVKPRAIVGSELGDTLKIGLSPTGERMLTEQSFSAPTERAALVSQLAEGLAVRAE